MYGFCQRPRDEDETKSPRVKFLVDNDLSHRLIPYLHSIFPNSVHVSEAPLNRSSSDTEIWSHAQERDFTILTKDGDFLRLAQQRGHPPKTVILRLGNCANDQVIDLLLSHQDLITEFTLHSPDPVLILRPT